MASRPLLKKFRHRVVICSAQDVVIADGVMVIARKDIYHTWASVESKRASMFSTAGYAIMEDRERQSHLITIRMHRDMDISSSAWVFEERLQSGNRWYKVLGTREILENGMYLEMSCRIVERGETASTPTGDEKPTAPDIMSPVPLSSQVKL